MIDRLRSTAEAAEKLAGPSLVIALLCFVYAMFTAFSSSSVEDDKYLFPSLLGFMWMLSFYAYVQTFKGIPQPLQQNLGFLARARHKLSRFWYWIIGLVFLATTAVVAVLSFRVLVVWFRTYGD